MANDTLENHLSNCQTEALEIGVRLEGISLMLERFDTDAPLKPHELTGIGYLVGDMAKRANELSDSLDANTIRPKAVPPE
jgi:hypothetical protein